MPWLLLLLLVISPLRADTMTTGTLREETIVYVDLRSGETIQFWLRSVPVCTDESGTVLSDPYLLTGAFTVSTDTLLRCVLTGDEEPPVGTGEPWYIKVIDTTTRPFGEPTGRVYSYEWVISSTNTGFTHTFYAAVPVNSSADPQEVSTPSRVMKLEVAGLRGADIRIAVNSTGVPGFHVQSQSYSADLPDRVPIYLSAPEEYRAATVPSGEASWSLSYASTVEGCEGLIPGEGPVVLESSSALTGLLGFVCDINGDNVLDYSSRDGDVVAALTVAPATASWTWSGEDAAGSGTVAPGIYRCDAGTFVGAAHALIENADVADPGVRLFERIDATTASGVSLFWSDVWLQDEVPLASGEVSPLQSGPEITSGSISDAADPPNNAHGWGNPSEALSRGSIGWIDTWTPGTFVPHASEKILVLDPDSDDDGDGLQLGVECALGTRPGEADTDGDGVHDGQEIADGTDPLDAADFAGGPEDTGARSSDSADPDSAVAIFGDFSGGAFTCAMTGAATRGGIWLPLLALLGVVRRRRRPT